MKTSIIKIGNSKGLRLSKTILEKYNIQDQVELTLEENQIVIKPLPKPRSGWDKQFEEMHKNGDDEPMMDDFFEDENLEEWT
ncbi:MAG: toxin-antitoxin system COG2336 family antidote component [Algoriphagus marincola HL-49]|uniref:Toxin-antitoxin system COG2336 family antidote component n=1 Tax=Algoriphagus marincola HL-49 TaxID=1305737 RepID=A0A0P8AJN4_9BACT|nr:MAG: toxin-antitoxin system COG2336 family antidote component [Algoriphagus marincola HL-49]